MINKFEILNNLVLELQIEINDIYKFSSERNNINKNISFNLNHNLTNSISEKKKKVEKLFEILNEEIKIGK